MAYKLYPITSLPGINRDGTKYSSNNYVDGQWIRFKKGLPRKILGYKVLTTDLVEIVRTTYVEPVASELHVYSGSASELLYLPIDQYGTVLGALVDRTPVAYVPNANNLWTLDSLFVTTANGNNIFAHPSQTLSNIDGSLELPVYYGPTNSTTPLITTGQTTSGGIVALPPYLILYGKNGTVKITNANDPTTLLNTARVTDMNIIQGAQVRGGNSSPAGLLWSLNSVIRMTQAGVGVDIDFRFDTLTDESSIMSARSVIEYDSRYLWIGIDKFFIYNGVVQELPNNFNSDYFFDNVNKAQRQKIWATKIPRFQEIWWFYPHGQDALECNHAIIYNIGLDIWFDTAINRASGYYAQVFDRPIWAGNEVVEDNFYRLWLHETGVNESINGVETAIESYYETSEIAYVAVGPEGKWTGTERWTLLKHFEPDFKDLSGAMNLTVTGRQFAQAADVDSVAYPFTSITTKVDMNGSGEQRRFMTLKFSSNEVDGYYEAGQILLSISTGDERK